MLSWFQQYAGTGAVAGGCGSSCQHGAGACAAGCADANDWGECVPTACAPCSTGDWENSPKWWGERRASCSPMRTSDAAPDAAREWSTPDAKPHVPSSSSAPGAVLPSTSEQARRRPPLSDEEELEPVAPSILDATCALLERVVEACPEHAVEGRVAAPVFHSVSVPAISAGNYLMTYLVRMGLAKKEELADAIVLHALCLIDRLLQLHEPNGLHLCKSNVHRVLLVAMVLSAKMLDDDLYNNKYWAAVGGVTLQHLNVLEVHMTQLLNFRTVVSARNLELVRQRLLEA